MAAARAITVMEKASGADAGAVFATGAEHATPAPERGALKSLK